MVYLAGLFVQDGAATAQLSTSDFHVRRHDQYCKGKRSAFHQPDQCVGGSAWLYSGGILAVGVALPGLLIAWHSNIVRMVFAVFTLGLHR